MSRYLVEQVTRQPQLRRIKDTKRNKYLKHPHGSDLWTKEEALTKVAALNQPSEPKGEFS